MSQFADQDRRVEIRFYLHSELGGEARVRPAGNREAEAVYLHPVVLITLISPRVFAVKVLTHP